MGSFPTVQLDFLPPGWGLRVGFGSLKFEALGTLL